MTISTHDFSFSNWSGHFVFTYEDFNRFPKINTHERTIILSPHYNYNHILHKENQLI
jgi:hypothetical protein